MKRLALTLLVLLVLTGIAVAGWVHVPNGKTSWDPNAQKAVTLWRRANDRSGLYPAERVLIYYNSTMFATAFATSSYEAAYDTGYWELDADGNMHPHSNLTVGVYNRRLDPGGWLDTEWDIDSDGNLQPKP